MYYSIFVFVIFTGIFGTYIAAESLDDLRKKYEELIGECLREHPVTAEDIAHLKIEKIPDNESAKCLFACAFRKAGMMDEKGFLSIEGVNKISQKYLSNDPEKAKKSEEFTEACKSVNDIPVTDGEKGCDRAALIFKCSVEKASQFSFV